MTSLIIASVAWAVAATAIGIRAAFGWRHALSEQRRLERWSAHWQQQASALADFLARSHEAASYRGKHARSMQMRQERARVAERTSQLKRELGG